MLALEAALDKKALEPVLLDVQGRASYTDYILVLSGRSDRQVQAIAEAVQESLRRNLGVHAIGIEGKRDGQWTLIDFGDIVVHVFYHPIRDFYDLEGLWGDAPRVHLQIPPESRLQVTDAYGL